MDRSRFTRLSGHRHRVLSDGGETLAVAARGIANPKDHSVAEGVFSDLPVFSMLYSQSGPYTEAWTRIWIARIAGRVGGAGPAAMKTACQNRFVP